MKLSDSILSTTMPHCPASKRAEYLPFLNAAMLEFDITNQLRAAAFLAQLAHESAELKYMEEIASGSAYEGRKDLGNTQPGDGKRYKGRGPIQLTGRANYKKFGELLGLDLINDPKIAATKEVGFRVAGLYWQSRKLNALADKRDFAKITRAINGGLNGESDRLMYYARALKALPVDFVLDDEPSTEVPSDVPEPIVAPDKGVTTGVDDGTQTSSPPSGAVTADAPKEVKIATMSPQSKALSFGMIGTAILGFLKEMWSSSQSTVLSAGQYAVAHLPLVLLIIGLAVLGVIIWNKAAARAAERTKQIVAITADPKSHDVVIT